MTVFHLTELTAHVREFLGELASKPSLHKSIVNSLPGADPEGCEAAGWVTLKGDRYAITDLGRCALKV